MKNKYLDEIVSGYLEAAHWTDTPENSQARFPSAEIEKAHKDCAAFVDDCGGLFEQAMAVDGYSARQFGRDFWLTRCGHGVGFWDRDELKIPAREQVIFLDRDGKTQATDAGDNLGDALSTVAYGNDRFISRFAHAGVSVYRGWLYFY